MLLRFAHLFLILSTAARLACADDWPNWRGPRYDGISRESEWDPRKIDQITWTAEVGTGFASVAVCDGRLYTLGHSGDRGGAGEETIYCLDAKTGKEIWATSYKAKLLPNLHEGGPASTPTVDGENLYTLSKDGRLLCSDARSGKRRWQRQLLEESAMDEPAEWGFASSPLILGELVIVEAAQTLAFDKEDGAPVWKSERYRPAYGTPTPFKAGARQCLATVKTDGLVILDAADGTTLASEDWETRFSTNANTPIIRGDQIFISTGYGRGCALFRYTGESLEPVYSSKNISNHMAGCVLVGGQLYGFDGNTHTGQTRLLKCLDFSTGEERWAQAGLGIGALCAAGDRLVILSEKGELIIAEASPEKFSPLHRAQVSSGRHWNVPVIANGFIYVRNAAGRLTAIKVSRD